MDDALTPTSTRVFQTAYHRLRREINMNRVTQSTKCALCLLFAIQTLQDGARAETNFAISSQPPVVWTLDNAKSIGGLRPEILGTPQVVEAADGGPALQFNGKNDGFILPGNPVRGLSKFTIEILFRPDADGLHAQRFVHIQDERGSRIMMETRLIGGKSWSLDTYLHSGDSSRALLDRTKLHPTGKWAWVALVYDGKTMSDYVDGVKELEGPVNFVPMADGRMSLGVRRNRVYWFKGRIKEVRFSPTALTTDNLQRLPEK
jgi:hypothetical protein